MQDHPDPSHPEWAVPPDASIPAQPDAGVPKKKGLTLLSWLVILGLVGFMVVRTLLSGMPGEGAQQQLRLQEILFDLQARYLVGAASFIPSERLALYRQAKGFERGNWKQRLKFIVLAGELAGAQEAFDKALELQQEMSAAGAPAEETVSKRQMKLCRLLSEAYDDFVNGDYRASSVSADNQAWLLDNLPWYGELALNPREGSTLPPAMAAPAGEAPALALEQGALDQAIRANALEPAITTFAVVLWVVICVGILACAGFIGFLVFLVLLVQRKLARGVTVGSAYGGVYAETFALFMVFFIGLSYLLHVIAWPINPLLKTSLVPIGSLLALGWPVARGLSWAQVRADIGWTLGRNPNLEPAIGVTCYVLSFPIVLVGFLLTLLLIMVKNQLSDAGLAALAQQEPIHPIVEFLVNGSALDRLLVIVDACILAPIVEETMFRGVLYRHLRELSHRWAWFWSVIFSGTIVSFLFAVIHPQGLVAVPVLMALAYGFTIAREWRGTLIPSMVGHALNNGLVVLFVILLMGR
jgi:membrane protease YdiL (CAAX protease family)